MMLPPLKFIISVINMFRIDIVLLCRGMASDQGLELNNVWFSSIEQLDGNTDLEDYLDARHTFLIICPIEYVSQRFSFSTAPKDFTFLLEVEANSPIELYENRLATLRLDSNVYVYQEKEKEISLHEAYRIKGGELIVKPMGLWNKEVLIDHLMFPNKFKKTLFSEQ